MENLKVGKPVLICVKSSPDKKWSSYAHIMLLIGLDSNGNAIICDTINRDWAGSNQRIKYAPVEELVTYMTSTTKKPTDLYWSNGAGKNGYILMK